MPKLINQDYKIKAVGELVFSQPLCPCPHLTWAALLRCFSDHARTHPAHVCASSPWNHLESSHVGVIKQSSSKPNWRLDRKPQPAKVFAAEERGVKMYAKLGWTVWEERVGSCSKCWARWPFHSGAMCRLGVFVWRTRPLKFIWKRNTGK